MRWPTWSIIVFAFIVALAAYMGAYYALVTPRWYWHYGRGTKRPAFVSGAVYYTKEATTTLDADYRYGGEIATTIFRPANEIDRRLPPGTWH